MSEAPTQLNASSPALRRIDWLAIAPWTLLLRVPGIALGRPFLLGLLGCLVLGITPDRVELGSFSLQEIFRLIGEHINGLIALPAQQINQLADPQKWQSWIMHTGWFIAWSFLGLAVIDHTSRALTNHSTTSLYELLKKSVTRFPKVIGVYALSIVATLLFAIPLVIATWSLKFELVANLLQSIWPLLTLALGLPVYLLMTGLFAFSPLALSAIVVDRADMFDATSRMYAYAYQKALRLIAYIGFALLLGTIAFYLFQTVVTGTQLILNELISYQTQQEMLRSFVTKIPVGYACGYFYSASAAIYLLLRQDIDDQPLDEMAAAE